MLFGIQTLINMAVNVGLLPAKGMTLPFISYGGSSLLAMALTMGFVLGLTRKRPMAGRVPRSAETESAAANRQSARSRWLEDPHRPARRWRHGRPSVSRGLARPGASAPRLCGRARHRHARREIWRRLPRPRHSPHSLRDADQPLAARRRRHLHPPRLRLCRCATHVAEGQARRGHRLWRLSHAAADHRREHAAHPDGHPRAERGDGARQSPARALRRPHRAVFHADQAACPGGASEGAC